MSLILISCFNVSAQQPVKSGPYKGIVLSRQQRIELREIDENHRESAQAVRANKSLSEKEKKLQLDKIRLKTHYFVVMNSRNIPIKMNLKLGLKKTISGNYRTLRIENN